MYSTLKLVLMTALIIWGAYGTEGKKANRAEDKMTNSNTLTRAMPATPSDSKVVHPPVKLESLNGTSSQSELANTTSVMISSNETTNITSDSTILTANPISEMRPAEESIIQKRKEGETNLINKFSRRISPKIFGKSKNQQDNDAQSNNKTQSTGRLRTIIWSPYSIYQSLVPLFHAASGKTQQELQALLLSNEGFTGDKIANASSESFNIRFEEPGNTTRNDLTSATGLFTREDLPLNAEYIKEIQHASANAELKQMDFNNVSAAAKYINKWVFEKTEGLIDEETVTEGQMDPNMFLMVVNCVRFKAPWQIKFDTALTHMSKFRGVNGVRRVQMMTQQSVLRYAEFPFSNEVNSDIEDVSFKVIELNYDGNDFVSLFILPNSTEDIPKTLEYIGNTGIGHIRMMLGLVEVEVTIPKFSINSDVDIQDALVENGIRTLFNPLEANLSKLFTPVVSNSMDEDNIKPKMKVIPAPYVTKMIHRTIFEVDEEGTKAGAVTSLSIVPLSALDDISLIRFNLNRPFLVMLLKKDTIIFEGCITDLPEHVKTPPSIKNSEMTPQEVPSLQGSVSKEPKLSNVSKENEPRNNLQTDKFNTSNDDSSTPANNGDKEESWWISEGIPEYLLPAATNNKTEVAQDIKNSTNTNATCESDPALDESLSGPAPSDKDPVLTSTLKFQQPEPKHPTGIRFPVTGSQVENEPGVKPKHGGFKKSVYFY